MISIDLGSNTLRVLKYDCKSSTKQAVFEKITRTADKMHEKSVINDEAVKRVVDAINEAKKKISFDGEDVVAVATAALRNAKNQTAILQTLKEKTGIEFKVITGEQEALLTSSAVDEVLKRRCPAYNESYLLVDIGGGSTEIIFKRRNEQVLESFNVGIVSVWQRYKTKEAVENGVKKECEEIKDFIRDCSHAFVAPDIFVATAGTPTTIAALLNGMDYESYDGESINGMRISLADIDEVYKKLQMSTVGERTRLVGVGREDLIFAGLMLFKEIFTISRFSECVVVDDGLREGVALAKCQDILKI